MNAVIGARSQIRMQCVFRVSMCQLLKKRAGIHCFYRWHLPITIYFITIILNSLFGQPRFLPNLARPQMPDSDCSVSRSIFTPGRSNKCEGTLSFRFCVGAHPRQRHFELTREKKNATHSKKRKIIRSVCSVSTRNDAHASICTHFRGCHLN